MQVRVDPRVDAGAESVRRGDDQVIAEVGRVADLPVQSNRVDARAADQAVAATATCQCVIAGTADQRVAVAATVEVDRVACRDRAGVDLERRIAAPAVEVEVGRRRPGENLIQHRDRLNT